MQIKTAHARYTGVTPDSFVNLANGLRNVHFGMNSDLAVVGVDVYRGELSVEAISRKEVATLQYDDENGVLVSEKKYRYAMRVFTLAENGVASVCGSGRDFKLLVAVCASSGYTLGIEPICIDLDTWSSALLGRYDAAQFVGCVIDRHYSDEHIGRWTAKAVDNRLHRDSLSKQAVKSMRFTYFHLDAKVSAEVRNDATLTVSCSDEELLDNMHRGHVALMLANAVSLGKE
jgi:hypothetical protein